MPTILLLTMDEVPDLDVETEPLAQVLQQRGVTTVIADWADPALGGHPADLALIRSTWNYSVRVEHFLSVLHRLPMPVLNPVAVAQWNAHKGYLVELAAAGVPVVPTVLVPRNSGQGLPTVASERMVIKPAVSAGARGVGRFDAGSAEAAAHLAELTAEGDALIQPFQESVAAGERSLIHIAGSYSHAVRKVPADGEFRVQEKHGGELYPHLATGVEIATAERALAAVPGSSGLLYARTDLIGPTDAPLVMEVELIEPDLFLRMAPGSMDRLADGLLARLR